MLLNVRQIVVLSSAICFMICEAAEKTADFSCNADSTNANLVNLTIRIIPHQDPIYKIYGFDAASGDTSLSANRIDDCVADTSGISDFDTEAIVFDLSFDITASSHECGATVTDLSGVSGVKEVTVILRVFAYSEIMLSGDDDVYVFKCRSDDLNSDFVSAGALDQSTVAVPSVIVLPAQYGSFLRIRDATTDFPLTVGALDQEVYLSVEFYPELAQGPDTYGTTFYIGFLGNDVISGTSASSLFIVVIPKYQGRTDVIVTTASGTQQQNVSDGSPMVFPLSSDLMGCSDDGTAEIDYKGVKVYSYDTEVAVTVYNREADTEGQYTALPLDVLGTNYYTVSMPTINDASELMIIGTENETSVSLSIPATTTLSVTFNGTTSSAGDTVSFTLNEFQTFHLAVSSSSVEESVTGYQVTSDKAVSVISGNRRYSDDHLVDQLSPVTQVGDHYILTPADPLGDGRLTTYIIQAVEAGNTLVTRYLSSSTNENYTITATTNPVTTITVAADEPCEIISDKPIQVTQIVNPPPSGSTDFEPAMLVMPPVYRWSNEYAHYQGDYFTKFVWVIPSSDTKVQINGADLSVGNIPVLGPNGYQFSSTGVTLPGDQSFTMGTSTDDNKVYNFLPIAYPQKSGTVDAGTVYIPPGLRQSVKDYCYSIGFRGDLVDNDCDGLIDEELPDELDNDGDSLFDEDTLAELSEFAGAVAIRPFNCLASGVEDFSDPTKIVALTSADGCYENRTGPLAMSGNFVNIVTSTIGSNTQPKQLKSGTFTLAKFVDSPKLYFKCDATYCFSSTDDNCRIICQTSTRKKRQEEDTPDNITSDIWIYPIAPGGDRADIIGNEERNVISARTCLENTNIQIMLAVLVALLALAISTALCFCCLFRRRRDTDKQLNRYTTNSGTSTTGRSHAHTTARYRF